MKAVEKYNRRVDDAQSLVCVNLDPELSRLPERFRGEAFPQFAFNKWIIEETREFVSAFKPNAAFYEARGEQGMEELQMTVQYLRERHPEIFLIYDAKRGDIGNTNRQYATAVFDTLGFDAVTLQPYAGEESLEPFLQREDKACIILCRTSNPGAGEFQDLVLEGIPLWQHVAGNVAAEWNERGNCMLVVGATYPEEIRAIRAIAGDMTFLVPGVGAQGGDAEAAVRFGLNAQGKGLILSAGRSVIFAQDPAKAARELRDEINASLPAGPAR